MIEYETICIAQPDVDDTTVQTLSEKLKSICGKDGGTILNLRDWGVRKLTYEIKKQKRGRYLFLNYLSDNDRLVPEIERHLRFDEKVLRFMTVRVAEVDNIQARVDVAKTAKEWVSPADPATYNDTYRQGSRHSGGHHDADDMGGFEGDNL